MILSAMEIFKQKKLAFFLILYSIFYILYSIQPAMADTMSNFQYKLDVNVSNMYKEPDSNLGDLEGKPSQVNSKQKDVNIYIRDNYKLIYPLDNSLFVFSVSPIFIDYGTISPNNPVKRTNTLSILSQHPTGYIVTAIQNHRLRNEESKTQIPDTNCDTGICSVETPDVWNSSLTYGFGYRCDNLYDYAHSCINDFSNTNYYKTFPSISESQKPYPIIVQKINPINSKALITYQVNVSRSQEKKSYSNSIIFMATSNF